jgi:hypothetical protein
MIDLRLGCTFFMSVCIDSAMYKECLTCANDLQYLFYKAFLDALHLGSVSEPNLVPRHKPEQRGYNPHLCSRHLNGDGRQVLVPMPQA